MRDVTDPLRPGPSVLFVATVASTIATFLLPYATHLRSLGWRVDAAASGADEDPAVVAAFDRVHALPLSRSITDVRGLVRGERAIAALLADTRPDIVHVHTPIASFVTRLAARRMPADRRPAVVYTAHGFHFHDGGPFLANAVFRTAERVAGRWTDRLIVINDEDERAARHYRIVRPDRLIRMPGIGLDTTAISPVGARRGPEGSMRHLLSIPPDAGLFVVVGELNANKRQIDAIAALATMRDPAAHLVIVGTGPQLPALEAQARTQGVATRTHFVGYSDDVPGILVEATALVATSAREGLSRSVMEALSLQVPVVASNARGNRELVGDSGWIVATGDVSGFAERMDWLSEHPDEGRSMGARGRTRMVAEYDVRRLIGLHEALYIELPARPPGDRSG